MKKAALIVSVLAVLIAVIAAAGCVGDSANTGNSGTAGTNNGTTVSSPVVGNWLCIKCPAHDLVQASEITLNEDGTGTFAYYKRGAEPVKGPLSWNIPDLGRPNEIHIVAIAPIKYIPTSTYTLSADGNTLERVGLAKMIRA